MGMKKTTSLKASFWKFLCMLSDWTNRCGGNTIQSYFSWNQYRTYYLCGLFRTQCTKDLAPVIAATPDLADVQLPMGCKYLVLDKNYQVTETTLEGDDLDRAMEYAISGTDKYKPQQTVFACDPRK